MNRGNGHCVQSDSEMLVLREASKLVGHSHPPGYAIDRILRLLSELLGLNRGRVLLPEPETATLRIQFAYGLTPQERARGVYGRGEGITGQVMETSQVGLVQDIDNEPGYLRRAVDRSILPPETVAYIAVPILLEEEVVGVLAVHRLRHRERPFRADLNILEIVATLIAQILRLHHLISESTIELAAETAVEPSVDDTGAEHGLIGTSRALRKALRQARHVANTRATVMLLGETGTGKEKFARMLHAASNRRDQAFVALNCAAIPEELLESELFGHEKGAFSGAVATKRGKFELADGGTLFLDELAELDLDMQSKLLRVLEERVVHRVGGTRDIPVDVRIVTATHQDLAAAVNGGTFRLDLYYRLNVFPVHLPPLRERTEDIPALARHFLASANAEFDREVELGQGVLDRLASQSWPGNVRQLENLIHRAALMAEGPLISARLMDTILAEESRIHHTGTSGDAAQAGSPGPGQTAGGVRPYARVDPNEGARLLAAVRQCGGNKTQAALMLGLTPRQLRYRLEKLGLEA
ncbi:sigma 54-interacting transcriptional regulator [Thiohalorhabdus sp. Cl-TMA]|uniref:Sigma 54-interacting transcriptional regulator n=1 Tax=Thiohalorhabdus methylotrophus TaxID=3242694 RepID=A0ABV4TYF2_9GAMM